MTASPAFQFYVKDFMMDSAILSAESAGAYIRMLCYQWSHGSVPENQQSLLALCGCSADALASIMHLFSRCENGGLQNAKLEEIRSKQTKFRESRADNAKARWNKMHKKSTRNASALQSECINHALHSSECISVPFLDLIPDSLKSSPEFLAKWNDWSEYRKAARKKLTAQAAKIQLKELEAMGVHGAIAAINKSIASSWTGLFPVEDRSRQAAKPAPAAKTGSGELSLEFLAALS